MPKAIFCPIGIRLVCMRYFSAYFLIFNADIVATPVLDTGLKPVKGDFYAISGWTNAIRIIVSTSAARRNCRPLPSYTITCFHQ
jgi:hypothetical protein